MIIPEALFKDVVTYYQHVKHVNIVAVVGEEKAEKNWAKIADPFIKADIKYFPHEELDFAKECIQK